MNDTRDHDVEAGEELSDVIIGHLALELDSQDPLAFDDAILVLGDADAMTRFARSAVGENGPDFSVREVPYPVLVNELSSGGAVAFDATSYARFGEASSREGIELPAFEDIAEDVAEMGVTLAVLELDLDEDEEELES